MVESRADFHFSPVGFSFLQVGQNFFRILCCYRKVLIRTADDLEILEGDTGLKIMPESFMDLVGNNVFDIDRECGNHGAKQNPGIIQYRKGNSRCQHFTAELSGRTGLSFPAEHFLFASSKEITVSRFLKAVFARPASSKNWPVVRLSRLARTLPCGSTKAAQLRYGRAC